VGGIAARGVGQGLDGVIFFTFLFFYKLPKQRGANRWCVSLSRPGFLVGFSARGKSFSVGGFCRGEKGSWFGAGVG
jgi:hypothetical protein